MDANGRLASAGYDGITEGEYLYNALGQQVQRTVSPSGSAVVTLSVHDLNGNRIAEYDGAGTLLREYIWLDGRPLAVVEDGNTYWLHWDHILRPVMATDATGTVVWAVRYLPFGGIDEVLVLTGALPDGTALRFPGQWFQAETGLHQNWMRDYDPTTGRYLQADPLGLVDGANVYGYARQGPVRWVDPSGQYALAGCAGGPIACTVTVVATVAAGIYAILAAPDAPDVPDPSDLANDGDNCDDDCGPLTRRQALAKAQALAQIPRACRKPIPFSRINPSSRGPEYARRQAQGAGHAGYECSWNLKHRIEDHPDGHPGLPGEPHHNCPHLHVYNAQGVLLDIIKYKRGS